MRQAAQVDVKVSQIAAAQEGVISMGQIAEVGGNRSYVMRRTKTGFLATARLRPPPFPALRGVYVHAGYPDSLLQRLWIAVLAAGHDPYVSHRPAGALQRLPGLVGVDPVVTVKHGQHQLLKDQFTVHQTRRPWPATNLVTIEGLKVTDVPATIVDLAGELSYSHLRHICEDQIHQRSAVFGKIARARRFGDYPGRPGRARLDRVLDELGPGVGLIRSVLERMFHDAVARAGHEPYAAQVRFPGQERPEYTADAGDDAAMLLVETDGRKWHDRTVQRERDRHRDRVAARHGYLTIRLPFEELRDDPEGTVAELEEIRQVRRRQFGRDAG